MATDWACLHSALKLEDSIEEVVAKHMKRSEKIYDVILEVKNKATNEAIDACIEIFKKGGCVGNRMADIEALRPKEKTNV